MLVTTEEERKIRSTDLIRKELENEEELEKARKNKGFTQVYLKGWAKNYGTFKR